MIHARVLVADPPWKFGDALPGASRGAVKNYRCLDLAEIQSFPLPRISQNALLCLWRVAAMQQEALSVIHRWGFTLKSELVWKKLTTGGKRHFGMGRIVRAEHEVCLLATRGTFHVSDRSIRSTFEAAVGRHSEKPDEFYRIVEQLSEGPYVELFARRERRGWICYGDEIGRANP